MAAATANGPSEAATQEGAPAPAGATLGNSSLYVGDLDREVSEAQLFELFSQIGPVASIRVCRDTVTRRSLGYAYVNYNTTLDPQAAERALETLNYAPLNGKPMRLMWSHRDPASRRSGVGNIFIKNLDKDIDNKALHDTFSAFGNILSCKVALDAAGQSKGYGFVHYEADESAEQAIEKVNGMLLEGKKVYVGPFVKRQDRPEGSEVRFTNVFVKNLADSVTEELLEGLFSKYGTVTSVVIMKSPEAEQASSQDDDSKASTKGFGFVNFETPEDAKAAVDALNGTDVEGKELFCGRAQKKSEREAALKQKFEEIRQERVAKYQGMNLYIKNLVDEVDDDKLRAEFEPFGTITSAKVMKDGTGKSKGFGFVCFTSPEEATKAVTEANSKMLMGKPMYVALAQRRDVRKAQLEQQYTQRMPGMGPAAGGRGPGGPMGSGPGMFPMGGANPMFYQAQANGMGGRGGGFGYPQMMGRGPGGRGGRGGRGRMGPAAAEFGMMGPGGFGPGGFGPAGPMGGPAGFPGRGGRGGRGRMGVGMAAGRGDMYGPEPGYGGPMGPGMGMGPDGYGPGPMGPAGRGGRGRGMGPDMVGRGLGGRGPAGRGPPGRGPMGPGAPLPPAPVPTAPSAVVPGQEGSGGLTTAMLAAAPPEQQKQMLGERLFPLVQRLQPELAGKITGMLLEMDNSELLLLLESPEALAAKVDEAIQVLKQHNALPEGINPDA